MGIPSVLTLVFAVALLTPTRGEYDSLEKKADASVPPRLKALRDGLLDSSMFQEAMFHVLSYYAPTDSDNPICSNHSTQYQIAFMEDRLWAIKMMDASTKLMDGLLQGNLQGLGSFDECLGVEEPSHQFTGQLCVVQTRGLMPPVVPNSETTQFSLIQALSLDSTLSICLPSTCTPADVMVHWQTVMAEFNASAVVSTTDCSVRGKVQLSHRFWVALYVLAALLLLILTSTYYDYSVAHQPTKEQQIWVCFSLYVNLRKLFHQNRLHGRLDVLDGIRVLAISWIVLGHRFEQSLQVPNLTLLNTEKYTTAWFMAPILNMMMAVELFFLLSGCLLAYQFLQSRSRGEQFHLIHFYYKRYIRLTPVLVFVMMLEACFMIYVSEGPLWKRLVGHRMNSCVDYWWSNLLYISNYINPYRTCVLQTWYLSVDMQLYLLSPLLLIPLYRSPKGLLLLAACYTATTAASFYNAFYFQLPAGSPVTLDKKTERNHGYEYVKTHVRAASWITGIALGYVIHVFKEKDQKWTMTKRTELVCWVVSVCMCVGALFSIAPFQPLNYQYDSLVDSLHISLHRNVFSLGAAIIIFLCICGRGGFVNDFLVWTGFCPLSTLSYGVFLSHMGLQMIGLARIRQPYSFDIFSLFTGFMSDLLMANLAAIILYISIEAPFWEIGRRLYNPEDTQRNIIQVHEKTSNINLEEEKYAA